MLDFLTQSRDWSKKMVKGLGKTLKRVVIREDVAPKPKEWLRKCSLEVVCVNFRILDWGKGKEATLFFFSLDLGFVSLIGNMRERKEC